MAVTPPKQTANKDPLHGITLEQLLTALVAHYGFAGLAQQINIRCFSHDPSIKSSLTFLRKTPWARTKVEQLYLGMIQHPLAKQWKNPSHSNTNSTNSDIWQRK